MPEPVIVQYWKHPRTPHWRQQMRLLGDDEHGIWLGMDEGAFFRKGADAPIPSPTPMVQLVRPGAWWTLLYNGSQHRYPVYVDVITPATWFGPRRVEMVDLDLDVVQLGDGSVRLLDEDEFADHRVSLAYPDDWIAGAERAADEVTGMLTDGLEPFAGRMQAWHDHLVSGAPPPA